MLNDWPTPRRTWGTYAIATDASDYGYGVCEQLMDTALAASIGRSSEKWRFITAGHQKARDAALVEKAPAPCPLSVDVTTAPSP